MADEGGVSLKDYIDALFAAERRRNDELRATDRKHNDDKFAEHNNTLGKSAEATALNNAQFAKQSELNALKDAFGVYKDITAKALDLAEGKSRGIDAVRVVAISVATAVGVLIAAWVALRTVGSG